MITYDSIRMQCEQFLIRIWILIRRIGTRRSWGKWYGLHNWIHLRIGHSIMVASYVHLPWASSKERGFTRIAWISDLSCWMRSVDMIAKQSFRWRLECTIQVRTAPWRFNAAVILSPMRHQFLDRVSDIFAISIALERIFDPFCMHFIDMEIKKDAPELTIIVRTFFDRIRVFTSHLMVVHMKLKNWGRISCGSTILYRA